METARMTTGVWFWCAVGACPFSRNTDPVGPKVTVIILNWVVLGRSGISALFSTLSTHVGRELSFGISSLFSFFGFTTGPWVLAADVGSGVDGVTFDVDGDGSSSSSCSCSLISRYPTISSGAMYALKKVTRFGSTLLQQSLSNATSSRKNRVLSRQMRSNAEGWWRPVAFV